MPVKLKGATSGDVTLDVPAVAGANTLILPAQNGTVGISGSLNAQNTTSGTSIDFTGIPAWVRKLTLMLNGVSTNGVSPLQVQIGSGSIQNTGYSSVSSGASAGIASYTISTGFGLHASAGDAAAYTRSGLVTIATLGGNVWAESHSLALPGYPAIAVGGGSVTLGGVLDRLRLTTINGTDVFDAGSVNVIYEG